MSSGCAVTRENVHQLAMCFHLDFQLEYGCVVVILCCYYGIGVTLCVLHHDCLQYEGSRHMFIVPGLVKFARHTLQPHTVQTNSKYVKHVAMYMLISTLHHTCCVLRCREFDTVRRTEIV